MLNVSNLIAYSVPGDYRRYTWHGGCHHTSSTKLAPYGMEFTCQAVVFQLILSYPSQKRDGGWIHTLLEEAENERMHLMTFMTLRKPGIFFRALVLGAQGVYYNIFCE